MQENFINSLNKNTKHFKKKENTNTLLEIKNKLKYEG